MVTDRLEHKPLLQYLGGRNSKEQVSCLSTFNVNGNNSVRFGYIFLEIKVVSENFKVSLLIENKE